MKSALDAEAARERDRETRRAIDLQEQETRAHDAARAAAVRLAETHRFYRRLAAAQARRFEPTPGWTAATLADVAELAASPEAALRPADLRDLAAGALAAADVEEFAPWLAPESGPFSYPSVLAAHPAEPVVAVARFGYALDELRLTVWLVNHRAGTARVLHAPVKVSQLLDAGSKGVPGAPRFPARRPRAGDGHPSRQRLRLGPLPARPPSRGSCRTWPARGRSPSCRAAAASGRSAAPSYAPSTPPAGNWRPAASAGRPSR